MPNIAETAQNPSSWLGKALGWMQSPQRTQHDLLSVSHSGVGESQQSAEKMLDAIGAFLRPKVMDSGSLYKVDLPDDQIAKMLDWDRLMSQQSPAVKKAWQDTKKMLPPNAIEDLGGDLSLMYGEDVRPQDFMNKWESLGQMAGGEMALKQQGIPGIRYLDQGSRGAGSGSSNFVVFPGNENILQILERNGNPVNKSISEFNNNLQSFIASRIK